MPLRMILLRTKPLVNSKDPNDIPGTPALDLTVQTIKYDPNVPIKIQKAAYITPETQMRPDLVSQFAYGDDEDTDLLLSFNGYSNPFSVETGDIFLIPERGSLSKFIRNRSISTNTNLAELVKVANSTKTNRKDPNREDYLKRKQENKATLANSSRNNLPPNFVDNGGSGIEPRNGRVIFGNNVSETDCVSGKTDAQIKSDIIRNRISKRFKDTLVEFKNPDQV